MPGDSIHDRDSVRDLRLRSRGAVGMVEVSFLRQTVELTPLQAHTFVRELVASIIDAEEQLRLLTVDVLA